jgi:hypothetical protein
MNAIEKAKVDIEWAINEVMRGTKLDYAPNRMAVLGKLKDIKEVLEAEKPAACGYDALAIAKIIALNDKELEDDAVLIQSFAASYHASECAKCRSKSCDTCKWEVAYAEDGSNPCRTCKGGIEIFRNWQPLPDAPKV